MKVDVHGRNLPVTPPLHDYVVKKMERVSRFLTPECRADVECSIERNPRIADSQTVETTIHCRGGETIRVRHSATDMYAAVDGTIDRLRRQAADHHDRRLRARQVTLGFQQQPEIKRRQRIPALIRRPGADQQQRTEFASLIDLAPTLLDIAGLPPMEPCDGRSLLPILRGETPDDWPTEIVAEFHGHHFPYSQRMIRDDRYKYVFNPESVNEFYDMLEDPSELHNVHEAPSYRSVRDALGIKLYKELVRRGDPAYTWMTYMNVVGDERAADVDAVADRVS